MQHRVFVSSTFVDLQPFRHAVQDAIRQLGAIDVSMEHFGARDARPKAECLRLIGNESDSFVGIYAHRYGFVPKRAAKSITEMEFDTASAVKLPRFVYLVNEEALWNPKLIEDGEAKKRLDKFKSRLNDMLITKRFSSSDQLAALVAADLGRHLATQQLQRVEPGTPTSAGKTDSKSLKSIEEWHLFRDRLYQERRGIFLVHTLSPSRIPGQLFDIFVYLRKHKAQRISEVAHTEFFLGRHWGNQIFKVSNRGGLIGLSTSAYGEFLCVCRVTFKDRTQLTLDRYIDFGSYSPPSVSPTLTTQRSRSDSSRMRRVSSWIGEV